MHATPLSEIDIDTDGDTDTDTDTAIEAAYSWDNVTLRANMIETLNGATTGPDALSGSIGTAADRRIFLGIRKTADVVIVGAGTFLAEAYRPLTSGPALCIVSNSLRLTASFETLKACSRKPMIVTCASSDPQRREDLSGVATVIVAGDDQVNLTLGVQRLAELGFSRMLCEGGPRLLTGLIEAGLVDELCLSIAARFADNPSGHHLVERLALPAFWDVQQTLCDADGVYLRLTPHRGARASR